MTGEKINYTKAALENFLKNCNIRPTPKQVIEDSVKCLGIIDCTEDAVDYAHDDERCFLNQIYGNMYRCRRCQGVEDWDFIINTTIPEEFE